MNARQIFSFKNAVILIIFIAAGAGALYFVSGKKEAISYRTAEAKKTDLRSLIQATGTLGAVETVDVGTQISGTIREIYIDYNSVVKKGQLIAEIDSATQAADVAQARANLSAAQADLMNSKAVLFNAEKKLARTRELARRDLIAKADVDADESSYLSAKAQTEASQAKIRQYRASLSKSEINFGYTKIYSPVDGVVVAKNVDKGQTVAASYQTPSIAEIAKDLRQMQVEVNVDEADIGGVRDGQKAFFTVDTHPAKQFEGTVTQVRLSPVTTNNVVTYTVIVKVANNENLLMPGMTANVSLIMDERDGVVAVPNSAFRFKPVTPGEQQANMGPMGRGKQNVAKVTVPALYTLDSKGAPVRHDVEKGITDGEKTEIVSGIKEGDRVITGIIVPKEDK